MSGLQQHVDHKIVYLAAKTGKFRNILLAGPPGVGKTTLAFMVADLLKKPAFKIQYHAEATPAEMFGMYVPDGTSFRWEAGPLDLAYTQGGVLIHDEIIEASGPCKTFLYGAFDNGRGGKIDYIGRSFEPKPGVMNFATMNGWPYEGALPDALLDRMTATFIILRPSAKQLSLLEPDLREMCEDSYDAAPDPMIGAKYSYRMFMAFQELRKIVPLEVAAMSMCYGNQEKAGSFLEALAMKTTEDDDGLMDDDEDDDDDE